MIPSLIEKLIQSCSREDHVDVKAFCEALGVSIKLDEKLRDLCEIKIDEKSEKPVIWLNPSLDKKTKLTFVVIALAEYILTPDRVSRTGIRYDIFFLDDIYHQRHGYRMLLATRLALPEHLINTISEVSPQSEQVINEANYLPKFLRCCVSDSSALFLINNFSDLSNR
jgi:hypothetical protein